MRDVDGPTNQQMKQVGGSKSKKMNSLVDRVQLRMLAALKPWISML